MKKSRWPPEKCGKSSESVRPRTWKGPLEKFPETIVSALSSRNEPVQHLFEKRTTQCWTGPLSSCRPTTKMVEKTGETGPKRLSKGREEKDEKYMRMKVPSNSSVRPYARMVGRLEPTQLRGLSLDQNPIGPARKRSIWLNDAATSFILLFFPHPGANLLTYCYYSTNPPDTSLHNREMSAKSWAEYCTNDGVLNCLCESINSICL